jgi:hypothetical protein
MKNEQIPTGYWKDAKGALIPEHLIKPIDRERDDLVKRIAGTAVNLSESLKTFKVAAFGDIQAFIELSLEQYGVKRGGKKGNVTLYTYDGAYKVQLAMDERMAFDERMQAAKVLIDECGREWTKDSRPEIQVIINAAFATDKEGKINISAILALRRLDISDERWKTAMQIIGESLQVIGTKSYIRIYQRIGDTNKYQPISLDIASV